MTTEFILNRLGVQQYETAMTAHMNRALGEGLQNARGNVNVDTGALAQSLETEPARLVRRTVSSQYLAGQDNLNPKSNTQTSTYARFVQRRFKSVVDPFVLGYLRGVRKKVNL